MISGYRPGQLYQHPEYERVGGAPQAETAEVVLGSIRAGVDLTTTEQGESFYGSLERRCALLELVLLQAAYGWGKMASMYGMRPLPEVSSLAQITRDELKAFQT